jgi:hypothetical protein
MQAYLKELRGKLHSNPYPVPKSLHYSHHDLTMLFRIARSTVFSIFFATLCVITKRLRLPGIPIHDNEKLERLAMGFTSSRLGFSPLYGCIGAVDGIAIKIVKPQDVDNPASYFCRKGF